MQKNLFHGVDFHVIWEPLNDEQARSSVEVCFEPRTWDPPVETESATYKAAYMAHRDAVDHGRILTQDRCLGRVYRSDKSADNALTLYLERTDYALFAATNLNLRKTLPNGDLHPFARCIQDVVKVPDETTGLSQKYLANPLNVIAAITTSDGFLIVPRRATNVGERGGTLQASVGGFWEKMDMNVGPKNTLIREAQEELGIVLDPDSIQYLCFGINLATGEPDLLALAHTDEDRDGVLRAHATRTAYSAHPEVYLSNDEREASGFWEVDDPRGPELERRMKQWRDADMWSQPSDRAVILAALIDQVGWERIEPLLFC